MNVPDGTDYSIDFSNLLVHSANAVDVFDIHLYIAAASANADQLMPASECIRCRSTDGARRTHNDYFHINFTTENANKQKNSKLDRKIDGMQDGIPNGTPTGHVTQCLQINQSR
jgi:hypothetical protein